MPQTCQSEYNSIIIVLGQTQNEYHTHADIYYTFPTIVTMSSEYIYIGVLYTIIRVSLVHCHKEVQVRSCYCYGDIYSKVRVQSHHNVYKEYYYTYKDVGVIGESTLGGTVNYSEE